MKRVIATIAILTLGVISFTVWKVKSTHNEKVVDNNEVEMRLHGCRLRITRGISYFYNFAGKIVLPYGKAIFICGILPQF